jgi:hypothetical protein
MLMTGPSTSFRKPENANLHYINGKTEKTLNEANGNFKATLRIISTQYPQGGLTVSSTGEALALPQ